MTNMATGDTSDVLKRLLDNLPAWFGETDPNLLALLSAYVNTGTFSYSQFVYDRLQGRIQTATDNNLDLISNDYFGADLPRRDGEPDEQYRQRILANLLLERATRRGLFNAIKLLTGRAPVLFEPWSPTDCGGYNVATATGYNIAGRYGSGGWAYQGFADVYVADGSGMANYSGYNCFLGGYNTVGGGPFFPRLWYGNAELVKFVVSDNDIYRLITATKAWGTIVWTRIHRGDTTAVSSLVYDDNGQILTDNDGQPIYI